MPILPVQVQIKYLTMSNLFMVLKKYFSFKGFMVTLGISIIVAIISSLILNTSLIKTFVVVIVAILINGLIIAFEKGGE